MNNNINSTFRQLEPSHPILNLVAKKIEPTGINSKYTQALIEYMLKLAAGKGHSKTDSRQMVGLAAPQVGASLRIILIDTAADGSNKKQNLEVFINPVLKNISSELIEGREGCWSCYNVCGVVERAKSLDITALDRTGKPIKRTLGGFTARIAQHEVDHLDGIRFPERIPVNKPDKLHWVEPEEFEKYRTQWMNWPNLCPRQRWYEIKNQASQPD